MKITVIQNITKKFHWVENLRQNLRKKNSFIFRLWGISGTLILIFTVFKKIRYTVLKSPNVWKNKSTKCALVWLRNEMRKRDVFVATVGFEWKGCDDRLNCCTVKLKNIKAMKRESYAYKKLHKWNHHMRRKTKILINLVIIPHSFTS